MYLFSASWLLIGQNLTPASLFPWPCDHHLTKLFPISKESSTFHNSVIEHSITSICKDFPSLLRIMNFLEAPFQTSPLQYSEVFSGFLKSNNGLDEHLWAFPQHLLLSSLATNALISYSQTPCSLSQPSAPGRAGIRFLSDLSLSADLSVLLGEKNVFLLRKLLE